MNIKEISDKEVQRINNIMKKLEILDEKSKSLVIVLKSYHEDCNFFQKKQKFLQSLEAAFICWAYIDAGLHLKVFKIPKKMMKDFTI